MQTNRISFSTSIIVYGRRRCGANSAQILSALCRKLQQLTHPPSHPPIIVPLYYVSQHITHTAAGGRGMKILSLFYSQEFHYECIYPHVAGLSSRVQERKLRSVPRSIYERRPFFCVALFDLPREAIRVFHPHQRPGEGGSIKNMVELLTIHFYYRFGLYQTVEVRKSKGTFVLVTIIIASNVIYCCVLFLWIFYYTAGSGREKMYRGLEKISLKFLYGGFIWSLN